jgi:hypothetical protein
MRLRRVCLSGSQPIPATELTMFPNPEILHCLHDSRTPFDEARKLAMAIPNAQLVGIDSANHLPLPGEQGFAVSSDAIRRFLGVAQDHPVEFGRQSGKGQAFTD